MKLNCADCYLDMLKEMIANGDVRLSQPESRQFQVIWSVGRVVVEGSGPTLEDALGDAIGNQDC